MRILLAFLLLFITTSAHAEMPTRHSEVKLISGVEGVDSLNSIQLGVVVKLEPGWKTYWRTPGEAGLAPVFNWGGSENLKSARVLWPAPKRDTVASIENYGYEGAVTFPINVDLDHPGSPLVAHLKLDLLVCNNICVPESHQLSITIPAREAVISTNQPLLAAAAKTLPRGDALTISSLEVTEDLKLRAKVTGAKISSTADMFVETVPFVAAGKPEIKYDAATKTSILTAALNTKETAEDLRDKISKRKIALTITDGKQAYERRAFLDGRAAPRLSERLRGLAQDHLDPFILLLAFAGGLILNLMPCVLPVLSLKILSVLAHGGKDHRIHRWSVFKHFTASAFGIVSSFWVMAAVLSMLKAGGNSIGWGIQFQHPGFLIFLIIVLSLFAANLWGMFEIPLPRFIAKNLPAKHTHEPTLFGHFLTGAFATLLATPCTAPFLGTAVGFALARSTVDIFVVFTFLGLGMAFPYMALALLPRVFKFLPKPGVWMTKLKKILSLALLLTAIWLLNVLLTVATQPTLDSGWEKFEEARIAPAVEDGRTVVVDITADWCLTCKANKRLVLDQPEVAAALGADNILRLQGDWTQRNETIAAYLRKYGRYGVPFDIVYGPDAPHGIILNELLTKRDVMRALAEAAGE